MVSEPSGPKEVKFKDDQEEKSEEFPSHGEMETKNTTRRMMKKLRGKQPLSFLRDKEWPWLKASLVWGNGLLVASAQCLRVAQPLDGLCSKAGASRQALRHHTGEVGVEVGTTFFGSTRVLVGVPPSFSSTG